MRILFPTAAVLSAICVSTKATTAFPFTTSVDDGCEAADLKRLAEPKLFESFLHCVDSMRRVQYPDGDQDTTHSVDISRRVLSAFLKRLDYQDLCTQGEAEVEFQFNIAPKGYTDPPICKDKVTIQFFPEDRAFRMVITSHFLVPPNWCTGQQVVYGFRLGNDRILAFGRDEAG